MNATPTERRVINAATKWRKAYLGWVRDDDHGPRDLAKNGENAALSKLLDALQALDREREYAARSVGPEDTHG